MSGSLFSRKGPAGRVLPFLFLILLFSACRENGPVINSIDPRLGVMGEILSIRGKNFGPPLDESYITIAGTPPTSSSYIEWKDDYISLRLPEFGEAGLVYVHVKGKKSNPVLFSNRATLPQPVKQEDMGIGPRISSVSPASGSIGSLITIRGSGFGNSREGGGVFFAWDAESSPAAPVESRGSESIEVSSVEDGYDTWNEREIRVRVPDGAVSGNLEVKTLRGSSPPVFFTVTGKPGTKTFRDKRIYTVSYTVDIQAEEAFPPNTLYLWVPYPVTSASQCKVELLSRSREPFVDNYRGTTLFQLPDLDSGWGERISQSYLVTVYGVETAVRGVPARPDPGYPLTAAYTLPSSLVPSDDPGVAAHAKALVGRETNPYEKARRLYEWLIRDGGIRGEAFSGGVTEALEQKQADPYTAALLFCALARSAGIPAIPISGALVSRNFSTSRHYWAEFWIDGFGWVPLDPALGAGIAPPAFPLREDRETYYFGSLDNQRITFSRGQTVLARMDPRGRLGVHNRDYALQNLWEEAVGGLESYSSLWGDVTITGMYVE